MGVDVSTYDELLNNNRVGPVLTGGPVAKAVAEAVEIDNPDKEILIEDRGAYVRIECDGEMIIRQESISDVLGRDFEIQELEIYLGSFSGCIESHDDYVRFYFEKNV